MMRARGKGRVAVFGHGDCDAVFLGRIPVVDVQVGDFVGLLFMGGYAHHVVRIGAVDPTGEGVKLTFDWNGFRDGRAGSSLLADDTTVPIDGYCCEVWRPDM